MKRISIQTILVAIGIVLLVSVVLVAGFESIYRNPEPESLVGGYIEETQTARVAGREPIVYRESLMPGGFHAISQLHESVLRDPVLAEAFRGFDWNAATTCVVPAGQFFISYRVGDRIRWTAGSGSLAGQPCVTDGSRTVLMRCGNLISYTPQDPVGFETPNDLEIPEPQAPPLQTVWTPAISTVSGVDAQLLPVVPIIPIGNIPVVSVYPVPPIVLYGNIPPVRVPEPNTTDLILIGLIVGALFLRNREIYRHRNRRLR